MTPNKIIDTLGGTNAVAALCEVKPQAVSQWRTSHIPNARLMFLKLARPDIFKEAPVSSDDNVPDEISPSAQEQAACDS